MREIVPQSWVPYEEVNVELARQEMLDHLLVEQGWLLEIGYTTGDVIIADFTQEDGEYTLDSQATLERLSMVSDDKSPNEGLHSVIKIDGKTTVRYMGANDEKFQVFIEELLKHGHELAEIQTALGELERVADIIGPEAVTIALHPTGGEDSRMTDPALRIAIQRHQNSKKKKHPYQPEEGSSDES
jgi:hypothetical protein